MILVITNGCFSILHAGHIDYLEKAAAYGTHLVVALDSDESVLRLKGRLLQTWEQRHRCLMALECVTNVVTLNSGGLPEIIRYLHPDFWIKGGDYTMDTLDQEEVAAAKEVGCTIRLIPIEHQISTTSILARGNPDANVVSGQ